MPTQGGFSMHRWIGFILIMIVSHRSHAAEKEKTDPLPWHLATVHSRMSNDIEFEKLSINLEISDIENKPTANFVTVHRP
jgi:hypothetical protein